MLTRILACALLLFSILFLPFWISVLLAIAGMVYFAFFWEAAILFLLSDLLYGTGENKFQGYIFISLTVAVLILIIIEIIKKWLKFYR